MLTSRPHETIARANNWSLTLAFHIIFICAQENFTLAKARVCLSVAMPLYNTQQFSEP